MAVLCAVYIAYSFTGSTVLDDYPKLTTMAFGAQYLQATLRTMISSVTRECHMPYRRNTLFAWLLMAINAASFLLSGEPIFNEFWLMAFICALGWGALAHYIYYVLQDFTRILDVNILTIKNKKKKEVPAAPAVKESPEGKSESAEKILNSKRTIQPKVKVTKTD